MTLALLCTSAAWAAPPKNVYLEQAKAMYLELRYQDALRTLELASKVGSDDPNEREEILLLEARCQIAEGHLREAKGSFVKLLELDPSFALGKDESPKIVEVFEAAKAEHPPADVKRAPTQVQPEPTPVVTQPPAAPVEPPHPLAPAPQPSVRVAPERTRSPAWWIGLASGAGALAVGGALLQLQSQSLAARAHTQGRWVDEARADQAAAEKDADWSTGLWIAAGALGAGAVVVYVF